MNEKRLNKALDNSNLCISSPSKGVQMTKRIEKPRKKECLVRSEAEKITNDDMSQYETFKYGYNQALSDYDSWLRSEEAEDIVFNTLKEFDAQSSLVDIAKAILEALAREGEK